MIPKLKSYILLLLIIASTLGCNPLMEPDVDRLGYDYFPLNTGEQRVYQVMQINYDGSTADTTYYQRMELVGTASQLNGVTSYRLERFIRLSDTSEWQIDSVWMARRTTYQAIVVENNVPIIKLSFPVQEDRRWDGNAMNAKEEDEFKIRNLGLSYQIDDRTYENSLEMVKEDLIDPCKITNDNIHFEVYAQLIGLIYRMDIDIDYPKGLSCDENRTNKSGILIEQKLTQYISVD